MENTEAQRCKVSSPASLSLEGRRYLSVGLCVQVLCPRTVQSEEEGIQKLNATFPTLERNMFPRITSFFFFFFADEAL